MRVQHNLKFVDNIKTCCIKMGDNTDNNDNQKRNRNKKRKRTFLVSARKYGKRGYYGRGEKLDEETYNYFIRSMEIFRDGFENDEEKHLFANNVFQQTESTEIICASNQVGCRVIETLLPFANDAVFERFINTIGGDLRPLCSHRFASHIIEAMLKETTKRSADNDMYKDFTIKVSRFLLNNLEDYMWDTYGNHTVRSVLSCLAQVPKEDDKKPLGKIEPEIETEIPDYYKEIVNDFGERIITWPQFKELPLSDLTSGFVQVLLKALKKVNKKMLKKYLTKLLDECFAPEQDNKSADELPVGFMATACIMLMETAVQVAGDKSFTKIYARCFKNRIVKLATMRNTNFAVQKLFGACKEKEEFESMFCEVEDHFKGIFDAGHSGVILALGQACKRLSTKQGSFIQSLMKAYECFKPEERQNRFVLCMAKSLPFDSIPKDLSKLESDRLNLHGTLMIQLMLDFNKPIKVVNSILSMDVTELKSLFCNSMGSHIVDSYVKSQFVGEKSREKLLRKMQGTFTDLAATKYGSRCFDALWEASNVKTKLHIMNELSYKDAAWSNSQYGKTIAFKINYGLYKRSKEEWQSSLNSGKAKKSLKEEILG